MNLPTPKYFPQVVSGLAGTALALSSAWCLLQPVMIGHLPVEPSVRQPTGSRYDAVGLRLSKPPMASWPKPPAQSQGRGWLYEVFTPPDIYYHSPAGSFALSPDDILPDSAGKEGGLELLVVKLEPYRLQYQGYLGGPGDFLVAFVSPEIPGPILVRPGGRIEQLGVTLKRFEASKVLLDGGESRPAFDLVALAVLHDEQTGAEVVLDSRFKKLTETAVAVIKFPGERGKVRELHEGETVNDAAATFRIERIQLDPPEVALAQIGPGQLKRHLPVLRPVIQPVLPSAQSNHDSRPLTPPEARTGQ